MEFDEISAPGAFNDLHCVLSSKFSLSNILFNSVRGWCKEYVEYHWDGENFNWHVSSAKELFNMLKGSSYYNPLNPGLFKFLADKSVDRFLINSLRNYDKKFSYEKIEDLDFIKRITVTGNNISESESTLIGNTLLDNKVTIGELCNLCTPRVTDYDATSYVLLSMFEDCNANCTLILDATEPLLEFYYSVKVCN